MESQKEMKYSPVSTILIIEDDSIVRRSVAEYLKDRGFNTLEADNGNSGLLMFRENQPELILLDLGLPEMHGFEVLKTVTNETSSIPVIIISGTGRIEDAVEALRLGAADYIIKPIIDMQILIYIIEKTIETSRLILQNQEYKQNLEAIFKSIKDAIIMVDKELKIVEFNKAAENICKLMYGNDFNVEKSGIFLSKCTGQCLDALNETIKTKLPTERNRFECSCMNGGRRIFSIATYPLFNIKDEFNGCVITIKDETRLYDLENDLQDRRQFQNIIGKSNELQKIYSLVEVLAKTPTTVLITGENGTGKGLVAEALHYHNTDASKKPFVVINCAALSDNLLESELFGHVKGAFTGAVSNRVGRFQLADGGTIFLDEIGDISHMMQLRLLRVIQDMEFEQVGDSKVIKVNIRIIAATNQDLKEKVRTKKFREDLYHRLKVAQIHMPSLASRREDIPLLTDFFIDKLNKKLNKNIKSLSADVQKLFMNYRWPGNVREFQHTLEYAFIICNKPIITMDNMPPDLIKTKTINNKFAVPETKERFGREAIIEALEKTGWNKSKAARHLGIGRRTLYNKIDEFRLEENR